MGLVNTLTNADRQAGPLDAGDGETRGDAEFKQRSIFKILPVSQISEGCYVAVRR